MEIDHEHTESSSGSASMEFSSSNHKKSSRKLEVYTEVLRRLMDFGGCLDDPSFHDELWHHFNRLPARYAMDVNVERADHVLVHKDLLQEAGKSKRPAWHVGLVQGPIMNPIVNQNPEKQESSNKISLHPPPMFGSSTNLQLLACDDHGDGVSDKIACRTMYEVTFAADDRPKLLNQLTLFLGVIDLNIHEAHAFSTNDGYSLDVFLVEGNQYQDIEQLKEALQFVIQRIEKQSRPELPPLHLLVEQAQNHDESQSGHVQIPTDESDVWEIDLRKLIVGDKIASGSYGDLYKGTYCSQDVAIKVLNPERMNTDMEREFAQEVFIMRKVRHKNLVQFIGASTRSPHLCIITEFMSGGSVYDFLHKQRGSFKLSALIRAAIDISKGMNYLHQNNIIHRDLKAANLLMDENQVIKVGDFGVSRVKDQSGVMTAETGTYRWMAPEVIEHNPYDQKADVFSFGVVLWELLTREIPHEQYTPLQAAVGVVQQGLRPTIPNSTNPKLARLLEACWQQNPKKRPDFSEIIVRLEKIAKEVKGYSRWA